MKDTYILLIINYKTFFKSKNIGKKQRKHTKNIGKRIAIDESMAHSPVIQTREVGRFIYSVFIDFTGLAKAAFSDCKLTVSRAIRVISKATPAKISQLSVIR